MTEEVALNVKIKEEKVTPEREVVKDDAERLLDSKPFSEIENLTDDKKAIEPTK